MNKEIKDKLDGLFDKNYHCYKNLTNEESVICFLITNIKLKENIDEQIEVGLKDIIQLAESILHKLNKDKYL